MSVFWHTKHTCPTLAKCGDDEPIFVIRAQDESAPAMIQGWLAMNPGISPEKRQNAIITMEAMRRWPKRKKAD